MQIDAFGYLLPDGEGGLALSWILENHRNILAADLFQFTLRHAQQVMAVEFHTFTFHNAGRVGYQTE